MSTQLARISPRLDIDTTTPTPSLSPPPPTQPASTMADDRSTTTGNITSNESDRNHQEGKRLRLFRRLQGQLNQEHLAERTRRMNELVTKSNDASTLDDIAALFDDVQGDAGLHFPGRHRPHEYDDLERWPSQDEMWLATANKPPPATLADVLALRQPAPLTVDNAITAEDYMLLLQRRLAPGNRAVDDEIRAILRRAIIPPTVPTTATTVESVVPTTERAVPDFTFTAASPSPPSSPRPPRVVTSLSSSSPRKLLEVPQRSPRRPLEPGEVRVSSRRSTTKRVRFE